MTLEQSGTVVRLSSRDWLVIIGLLVTVMTGVLGAYLTHDRLLMKLVIQQEAMNARLDKIERQLDSGR